MDYKDIGHISRGVLELGKLRIQADGIAFKSLSSSHVVHVKHSDIDLTEWIKVARGYEVKVISREGHVFKFNGFKESDYGDVKDFFKQHFGKDLKPVELCVKGWNWGESVFKGSLLSFLVDSKPAFEVPLEEVSRVTSGKNEVSLEFHQNETAPVSLVEMRFHIPTMGTDGEDDPVQSFHDKVQAKADILQATGNAIASFSEMQCLTPRGRYTIKVYPTFLGAHGKSFDYKIPFTTITRLFLLPHNNQQHLFLVLGLDPPIRQGQTRYPFFIVQMEQNDTCELTLAISEEDLKEKYGGKLTQELEGPLFEVFARLMKVLVGKKMIVPGSFRNHGGQHGLSCSYKAASGFLYPLDKGFIFVHKPPIFIRFENIARVNFERMSSGGMSRSFDFDIETKDGITHHFSSLMRDDYGRLHDFVVDKNLKIKDKGKSKVAYNDELSGNSSDEHDAYLERMKAEGEEASSEDSDFVAGKESESDNDLEYDSDAPISDGDENSGKEGEKKEKKKEKKRDKESEEEEEEEDEEEEEQEKARKRTKKSAPKSRPSKKRKEESSSTTKKATKTTEKKKKDPNAPKKPLSSYMLWLQDMRPVIKKKYPELSMTEISKKAGEMWKAVVDKSKWEERAKALKEKYQKDLKEYEKTGKYNKTSPVKSSPTKSKGSKKSGASFKSEEFVVDSDDESSGDDKKKKANTSVMKKEKEEEEEEESEAEMTDDEESD